jgi:hypothetical protein
MFVIFWISILTILQEKPQFLHDFADIVEIAIAVLQLLKRKQLKKIKVLLGLFK